MTKFWNKTSNDEIYIYGDIVSDKLFDNEVTATEFAADFNSCKNPVLHINSNGGDVFTALAIHNTIKKSDKFVTATIDGICASAATLIACAADKVYMAENALYMIHLPSVYLFDLYDKIQLEKVVKSLVKVESSLLKIYQSRTDSADLQAMLEAETWLSAAEAKDLNFVDEVTGTADIEINDAQKLIIMNKVKVRKNYFTKAKEKLKVDKTFLQKLKDILKGEEEQTEQTDQTVTNAVRAQELDRIKNLNALRCGNEFVDALIDTAISEGRAAAEVKKFVDALKNVKPENKVLDKIAALIEDNLKSGAGEVTGSSGSEKSDKITAEMISKYAR